MNLEKALAVMEGAAIKAASALKRLQPRSRRLESRKDFLADADLRSEEIILHTLATEYPDIPTLSEEKGGTETSEGYLWVIDPIDGTINFFLQDDHWGISIALVENGVTIAGVIYLPARKQMFSASCEATTRLRVIGKKGDNLTNPRVNRENRLTDSQFWVGWGKEEHGGDDHQKVYDVIGGLDRHSLYPQIRNSATADMMTIVCGKIMGYVFLKPEPFDIAAAGLLIEQAGGKVTDADGNPWGPFSHSLIASNGVLHDDLLRIIQSA